MIPIPAFVTPRLIAGIAVSSALVLSGWMARGKWDASTIADLKLAQVQRIADAEKRAREAVESVRVREAALTTKTQEIVDEARKTIVDLERDIATADSASRGLQDAARRAASRCSPGANATPTSGGTGPIVPSSMSDGDRWLRVFGELNGAAGAYAEDSGRARAARSACEAAYTAAMKAVNH